MRQKEPGVIRSQEQVHTVSPLQMTCPAQMLLVHISGVFYQLAACHCEAHLPFIDRHNVAATASGSQSSCLCVTSGNDFFSSPNKQENMPNSGCGPLKGERVAAPATCSSVQIAARSPKKSGSCSTRTQREGKTQAVHSRPFAGHPALQHTTLS